jgi:hypothetical protein
MLVPQRRKYASHRYLPPKVDAVVTAERNALRAKEEAEKGRLQAQAEAAGKAWDPSAFKSALDDESNTSVDRSKFHLLDMVQWGIAHPAAACDALLDVLEEIKLATEFPVMIAVDGINELYEDSPYPEAGSGAMLPASRLTVPSAFHCVGADGLKPEAGLKRGLWVGTVSFKHSEGLKMFKDARVRGRLRVPVPPLTRQETFSVLSHYARTGAFMMLEGE